MMRHHAVLLALFAFLFGALVVGCGGGGGGGTSGGGNSGSNSGTNGTNGGFPGAGQFIEILNPNGVKVDPLNLQVGLNYTVQAVNYDTFGTRTILTVTQYSKEGSGASAITLTSAGVLTLNSAPSGTATIVVSYRVSGQIKTSRQDVNVPPSGSVATVRGRILSTDGTTAVANVQVEIYNALGSYVGGAVTGSDGRFSATVGSSARSLTLKPESIPTTYYRAMRYQGDYYAVVGQVCPLVLPTVTSGQTVTLPADIFLPRQIDGPPPPPSGCN